MAQQFLHDLRGAGGRWSAEQLRLRLVDATRLNPATIMPSFYRVDVVTNPGPWTRFVARVRAGEIERRDAAGSIFGVIDQKVVRYPA